jgi:hypothetical protein
MGLEKAIQYGKEKRRPYKGAKAVDCSCRNHGTCEWCRQNRLYKTIRDLIKTENELNELDKDE